MSDDVSVIWKKGDNDMPERAKKVVLAAQDELLLKALQLPPEVIDTIRFNAEKNSQTVNGYISEIVIERLRAAS